MLQCMCEFITVPEVCFELQNGYDRIRGLGKILGLNPDCLQFIPVSLLWRDESRLSSVEQRIVLSPEIVEDMFDKHTLNKF